MTEYKTTGCSCSSEDCRLRGCALLREHPSRSYYAVVPQTPVQIDLYGLLDRAVEEGVALGYNRAFKHTDQPEAHYVKECIQREVLNAICEILIFPERS
jgi:hypothetical protein